MPSSNAKTPDAAYVKLNSSGSSSSLREADEAAEYAEALGASSPLLDLVDALFELRTRGFVVRQVRFILRLEAALFSRGILRSQMALC